MVLSAYFLVSFWRNSACCHHHIMSVIAEIANYLRPNIFFFEPNTCSRLTIKFIAKYEKEDAMVDAIVAACTAGYSIFNNSSRIKNLVTLLIISNIESAKIIFVTICFKTGRFNFPVNLFVYFSLYQDEIE